MGASAEGTSMKGKEKKAMGMGTQHLQRLASR